jgi:hypothetical protein
LISGVTDVFDRLSLRSRGAPLLTILRSLSQQE